jgi:AraC family transcriptional regulator, arabinose operon regulatory protein
MDLYYSRHLVTTERDRRLPLHLTSVGYTEHQSPISRDNGFPCFHWLHTVDGCGEFTMNGSTLKLPANHGLLIKPHVPHSYSAENRNWSTWYLTFDGALAHAIIAALDIQPMLPIRWETDCPLAALHKQFEEKCRYSFDFAGINGSHEVYAFLSQIKQYGQVSGQPSLSKGHERLTPVYLLIEEEYDDPNLGLTRLADELAISSQHLNTLFRKSWGVSPYQYLLQFRIQKSKELLLSDRAWAVKKISAAVGFQDYSHFVSTFRRVAGMTPVQFRRQYSE